VREDLTIEDKINALVWVCIDGFLDWDFTEKIISRYVNEQMTPIQRAIWLDKQAKQKEDNLQKMRQEHDG
jgi:hypothetical protein